MILSSISLCCLLVGVCMCFPCMLVCMCVRIQVQCSFLPMICASIYHTYMHIFVFLLANYGLCAYQGHYSAPILLLFNLPFLPILKSHVVWFYSKLMTIMWVRWGLIFTSNCRNYGFWLPTKSFSWDFEALHHSGRSALTILIQG